MGGIQTVSVSEFKAKCLEMLQKLGDRQLERVIVTKRGRPVAVLTPPETEVDAVREIHGFMRGSVTIPENFDLTAPAADAPFEAEDGKLHG